MDCVSTHVAQEHRARVLYAADQVFLAGSSAAAPGTSPMPRSQLITLRDQLKCL